MKAISLRRFREQIGDIREQVSVVRREPDTGDYKLLGYWTPAHPQLTREPVEPPDDDTTRSEPIEQS